MDISRSVSAVAGVVTAPWFYVAGRVLSAPSLNKLALLADPQYMRALQKSGRPDHSGNHVLQFQIAAMLALEATPDAAQRIKCMLGLSESQRLQDIFCAIVCGEKREGFFVEVGVGSGRTISNTYMLEKNYGWRGVLVEPNRSSHASIVACREATLERRAAAAKGGQTLRFQEILDAGEYSRVVGSGGHAMPGARSAEYEVETVALTDILDGMGAPAEIDFLSLDTEGSELDILQGLDLQKYHFSVMAIEHNFDRRVQKKLNSILEPLGYRHVYPHISGFDAWYVHEDVSAPGFRLPQSRG